MHLNPRDSFLGPSGGTLYQYPGLLYETEELFPAGSNSRPMCSRCWFFFGYGFMGGVPNSSRNPIVANSKCRQEFGHHIGEPDSDFSLASKPLRGASERTSTPKTGDDESPSSNSHSPSISHQDPISLKSKGFAVYESEPSMNLYILMYRHNIVNKNDQSC